MKCRVERDERYPHMTLDKIGSKAQDDPLLVDVPPRLLNAVQKAEHALEDAELAVLEHLEATGQLDRGKALGGDRYWLDALRDEAASRQGNDG